MQNKGSLYLIPTPLSSNANSNTVVPVAKEIILKLDNFIVEDLRTSRRYISSLDLGLTIEDLNFSELNKKTPDSQISTLLAPLKEGIDLGLMSEAGCPGIADPGARAVALAHKWGCRVQPVTGPSSIFLALMASGFNGQNFSFNGYLPIKPKELGKKILELEEESRKKDTTQIFIEAPYRNNKLLQQLANTCNPNTRICVARDITGEQEYIATKTAREWLGEKLELHKIPSIFLMYSR